jgi:hypothetical protein
VCGGGWGECQAWKISPVFSHETRRKAILTSLVEGGEELNPAIAGIGVTVERREILETERIVSAFPLGEGEGVGFVFRNPRAKREGVFHGGGCVCVSHNAITLKESFTLCKRYFHYSKTFFRAIAKTVPSLAIIARAFCKRV